MPQYHDYHGDQLTLQEICRKEGLPVAIVTAEQRRRANPGQHWSYYLRKIDKIKHLVVGDRQVTYKQIADESGKSIHAARNRYKMYMDGRITAEDVFSTTDLPKPRNYEDENPTEEWKNLGDEPRHRNLSKITETKYERENFPYIPPATGNIRLPHDEVSL